MKHAKTLAPLTLARSLLHRAVAVCCVCCTRVQRNEANDMANTNGKRERKKKEKESESGRNQSVAYDCVYLLSQRFVPFACWAHYCMWLSVCLCISIVGCPFENRCRRRRRCFVMYSIMSLLVARYHLETHYFVLFWILRVLVCPFFRCGIHMCVGAFAWLCST